MSQAPSTLGIITTSSLCADLAHQRGQVVEHPRGLEAVDPRPELGLAELHLLADADQAVASGLLAVDRYRVLEVAEQDVHGRRDVGHLRDHLLVGEVQEVDHPRGLERDLQERRGGADRKRLSEVTGVSQSSSLLIDSVTNASGRRRRALWPREAGTTSHAPSAHGRVRFCSRWAGGTSNARLRRSRGPRSSPAWREDGGSGSDPGPDTFPWVADRPVRDIRALARHAFEFLAAQRPVRHMRHLRVSRATNVRLAAPRGRQPWHPPEKQS